MHAEKASYVLGTVLDSVEVIITAFDDLLFY